MKQSKCGLALKRHLFLYLNNTILETNNRVLQYLILAFNYSELYSRKYLNYITSLYINFIYVVFVP